MTRRANVTYQPDTSVNYPWNVGLYDDEDTVDDGYVESVGAVSHADAIHVACEWARTGDILPSGMPTPWTSSVGP